MSLALTAILVLSILFTLAVGVIAYLFLTVLPRERARAEEKAQDEVFGEIGADVEEEFRKYIIPGTIMSHFRTRLSNQSEQFTPFDSRFRYDPADVRYVGGEYPLDFLIFKGHSKGRIEEVVFLEVKQHPKLRLEGCEPSLKEAVEAGRVRWERFDLADGPGVTRDTVLDLGAKDLIVQASKKVHVKIRNVRDRFVARRTKHL